MPATEVLHFYSHVTGVSLELPVGFEFVGEDATSATYADLDDDAMHDTTPRVQVQVVGTIEGADGRDVVRGLADGFAAVEGEVIERRDREVDGAPASTVVLHRSTDGLYLHTTAIADERRLLTVVAAAPAAESMPAFDRAIDSIRLITL